MLADGFHDIPAGKVAMIVTHLEMRKAPDLKPLILTEGVTFRPVEATPEWYRDVYTRVGAQEWLWFSRLELDDAGLSNIINDPKVEIFTLEKDGQDEALLELDFRVDGECELAFFGLTRALIGSGAGRYLMNEAITRAFARGVQRFHVHTCTIDSPQALSFYRRSGFTPTRQQVEVADDPRVLQLLPSDAGPNVPIFRP